MCNLLHAKIAHVTTALVNMCGTSHAVACNQCTHSEYSGVMDCPQSLQMIFKAVVVAKLTYASPAWWGFRLLLPMIEIEWNDSWSSVAGESGCTTGLRCRWRQPSADKSLKLVLSEAHLFSTKYQPTTPNTFQCNNYQEFNDFIVLCYCTIHCILSYYCTFYSIVLLSYI